MNAEQIIAKQQEQRQSRITSKRNYDKNKDKINARKRERRRELKDLKLGINRKEPVVEVEPVVEPEPIVMDEEPVVVEPTKKSKKNKVVMTHADLVKTLKDMGAHKIYITTANRLNKYIEIPDYVRFINNKYLVDGLRQLTHINKNTMKANIQGLLYFADKIDILRPVIKDEARERLRLYFEELKLDSKQHTADRKETAVIPTFDEYIAKAKEAYGNSSKAVAVASIYKEVSGLRDNLKALRISDYKKNNEDDNWIYLGDENAVIHIGNHKTSKKYGAIHESLSSGLSDILREYMNKNRKKVGDYLFGGTSLSSFIGEVNKRLGFQSTGAAVNLMREMSVNKHGFIEEQTNQQRAEIAKAHKHGTASQASYARRQKTKKQK